MSSTEFSNSNQSPRIERATNLPAANAFTMLMVGQIPSYVDWGELFSLSNAAVECVFFESDAAGELYIARDNASVSFAASNVWVDGYTGIFGLAVTGDGTTNQSYYQRAGGAFTTSASVNFATFTPSKFSFGGLSDFGTQSPNSPVRFSKMAVWSAVLTPAEIALEFAYRRAQRTANLTFWNPCNDAANVHKDRSGTGGDATLTGSPTDNSSDIGVPWDPYNALRGEPPAPPSVLPPQLYRGVVQAAPPPAPVVYSVRQLPEITRPLAATLAQGSAHSPGVVDGSVLGVAWPDELPSVPPRQRRFEGANAQIATALVAALTSRPAPLAAQPTPSLVPGSSNDPGVVDVGINGVGWPDDLPAVLRQTLLPGVVPAGAPALPPQVLRTMPVPLPDEFPVLVRGSAHDPGVVDGGALAVAWPDVPPPPIPPALYRGVAPVAVPAAAVVLRTRPEQPSFFFFSSVLLGGVVPVAPPQPVVRGMSVVATLATPSPTLFVGSANDPGVVDGGVLAVAWPDESVPRLPPVLYRGVAPASPAIAGAVLRAFLPDLLPTPRPEFRVGVPGFAGNISLSLSGMGSGEYSGSALAQYLVTPIGGQTQESGGTAVSYLLISPAGQYLAGDFSPLSLNLVATPLGATQSGDPGAVQVLSGVIFLLQVGGVSGERGGAAAAGLTAVQVGPEPIELAGPPTSSFTVAPVGTVQSGYQGVPLIGYSLSQSGIDAAGLAGAGLVPFTVGPVGDSGPAGAFVSVLLVGQQSGLDARGTAGAAALGLTSSLAGQDTQGDAGASVGVLAVQPRGAGSGEQPGTLFSAYAIQPAGARSQEQPGAGPVLSYQLYPVGGPADLQAGSLQIPFNTLPFGASSQGSAGASVTLTLTNLFFAFTGAPSSEAPGWFRVVLAPLPGTGVPPVKPHLGISVRVRGFVTHLPHILTSARPKKKT